MVSNSIGAGYRFEWYTTESFALGSLVHFGLNRTGEEFSSLDISDVDSLNLIYDEGSLNTYFVVPNFSLNASYSFDDHWSLSSTLGYVLPVAIGQGPGNQPTGLTTLNLGYSIQRWSLFLEGVARFHRAGPDFSVNGGFTYSVSRDFQLDAFFRTRDWGQYEVVGSQPVSVGIFTGFTYIIR